MRFVSPTYLGTGKVVGNDGEVGVGEELLGDGHTVAAAELEDGDGDSGGEAGEQSVEVAESGGGVWNGPFVVACSDGIVRGFEAGFEV